MINQKLYWDNIPVSILKKLKIKTFLVTETVAAEMDTLEHYKMISSQLGSAPMAVFNH